MSEHHHGPDCGHNHSHNHTPKITPKAIVWATVAAAVVGLGAYFISKLGEKSTNDATSTNPDNAWQQSVTEDKRTEKYR